jgi:hypothetical protein
MYTSAVISYLKKELIIGPSINGPIEKSICLATIKEAISHCIDDNTDIPLLLRWLEDNLNYNSAFEVLYYLIIYLTDIKKLPEKDLLDLYSLLSIDTLNILCNKKRIDALPENIRIVLERVLVSKVKDAIKSKEDNYNIFFGEAELFNSYEGIPKILPLYAYDKIDIDKFLNDKPYIILCRNYDDVSYYDFSLTIYNNYLCHIVLYADGIINIVTFLNSRIDLETVIQNKITICSGNSYQELFDNLKNNKFSKKTIRIAGFLQYDSTMGSFLYKR